jgi:hypothetical protein
MKWKTWPKHFALFTEPGGVRNEFLAFAENSSLRLPEDLVRCHDALLFVCAYASSRAEYKRAERCLISLSVDASSKSGLLVNTGLAHSAMEAYYTPDCLLWLSNQPGFQVRMLRFDKPEHLNLLLRNTVPSWLVPDTLLEVYGLDLLRLWEVKPGREWQFLGQQLARWKGRLSLCEQAWEQTSPVVRIESRNRSFSRTFNRLNFVPLFYSREMMRRFDHEALMNSPLPAPEKLSVERFLAVERAAKLAMVLLARETDPTTYMQPNSLRFFQLERGISIALYGMDSERQLPFESYIGFTLFKNGWPCAYGGSWVFGKKAKFGMNIFEPFRGGESGYIMCQLLRTYKQFFNLESIEVEAYQFGLDNEDGIKSGAYWFYYRYGFRSVDPTLASLAEKEKQRMFRKPGCRSSEHTLKRFTQSNVVLTWDDQQSEMVESLVDKVHRMIVRKYSNDHSVAEEEALIWLCGINRPIALSRAWAESALMALALGRTSEVDRVIVAQMAALKETDEYGYQAVLHQWLNA